MDLDFRPPLAVQEEAGVQEFPRKVSYFNSTVHQQLRVMETVISRRTSRILLVLDRCYDVHNQQTVLRTAECLGIQHVWIVLPVEIKGKEKIQKNITKGYHVFLSIRKFQTSEECVKALKEEGRTIWATALSTNAVSLDTVVHQDIPQKLALVIGREADGCSQAMLEAADKCVYLPLHGFTESLNLSVAAAMICQYILDLCPEAKGDLYPEEKQKLRTDWYKLTVPKEQETVVQEFLTHPPETLHDLVGQSISIESLYQNCGNLFKETVYS
eukprot:TRINITY_DN4155_c0_g1_i2.p1 TRINITY_DN4155_c0_g1~~TRINITY_DN4155_c0_g1_i2.p1  ORF type:complete len:271 (+),score=49.15 TRINITY_DN4155_c0_g1_i2:82-894(+)